MEYKLIFWNVNTVNSSQKLRTISHCLKKQTNIICLQETHIKKQECKFVLNKQLGKGFYYLATQK